jgi:arylsulfatase A-like enzyme
MHRPGQITLLGLALLAVACGSGESPEIGDAYYDLVAQLGAAGVEIDASETLPVAKPDEDLLFLPTGASVEYLLFAEPDSTFRAEGVVVRGEGMRLEAYVETDEDGERELLSLSESKEDLAEPLGLGFRAPVRLGLRTVGGDSDPGSGVALKSPALWAPIKEATGPLPAVEKPSRRPNVLIYLVDTLRSDRLGCLGYPKPITPNIDRFAAVSSLFLNAVGQSSWTKASVASIFTGLWPPAHGAIGWKHKLSDEIDTLAEFLHAEGYQTAAFVTNPNVVKTFGFTQGFDEFTRKLKRPSDQVNAMAFDWIDGRREDAPFLLYLHTMDPHAPYAPPEPFRSEFAPNADEMPHWQPRWRWPMEALPYLSDLYDAEIAFNDDSFGKLLDFLEERGVYDETMIIFASDHGEEFKEHGRWRHGANLHAETLNFPLIIKFPGQSEGVRVGQTVQHIDLLPTILSNVGLDIPPALDGRDLTGFGGDDAVPADGVPSSIYSHLRLGRGPLNHSVVSGQWKLIRRLGEEGWQFSLFDWREDPNETNDLAGERPVLAAVLSASIDRKVTSGEEAEAVEEVTLSKEMEEDLRALGYLE